MEKQLTEKIHEVRSLLYVPKKINKIDKFPCMTNFFPVHYGSLYLLLRYKAFSLKLQFVNFYPSWFSFYYARVFYQLSWIMW